MIGGLAGLLLLAVGVVSVHIPAIGLGATAVLVGTDAQGAIEAPEDPDTVAWMPVGEHHVVLAGHVDWAGLPRTGAHLKDLKPGDTVQLDMTDGSVRSYTVQWSKLLPFDAVPRKLLYPEGESDTLVAITCGGTFVPGIGYLGRQVVWSNRNGN